jgi:hypothetical protein
VAVGVRGGEEYVDVGTLQGYRAAIRLLQQVSDEGTPALKAIGKEG